MIRWLVMTAGLLGFLSVLIGAFGAHGLETRLSGQGFASEEIAKKIEQCEIAVRYQMFHSLAVLALGIMGSQACTTKRAVAATSFLAGIALFSGGLYSMVFLDTMGHWAIVPLGGLCFMVGWVGMVLVGIDISSAGTECSGEPVES